MRQRNRFDFERSPMPEEQDGYTPPDPGELTTNTMVEDSRAYGTAVGKVGNRIVAGNVPTPVLEQVFQPNGFSYLKDLIPDVSGKLGVNLKVPSYLSAGCTLQTGYVSTLPNEVVNPSAGEPPLTGAAPYRDHRLWVQFGAGASEHQAEIDTGQGNSMQISGDNVRAMLVDWSWARNIGLYTWQPLTTDLSMAAAVPATPGFCTTRVCAPYQRVLDLQDLPTVEEWKRQLAEACALRQYVR